MHAWLTPLLGLVLAPLLFGIINKTKAWFGGRRGPPLLQLYFDVWKLLRKGAVYSRTTTWIFRAGPIGGLAAMLAALTLVPAGGLAAPLAFVGDLVLFAGLLAVARFLTVLAALDTGSAFEGMGASREVQFSALAEPALFLGLAAAAKLAGSLSLTGICARATPALWDTAAPSLVLAGAALLVVFLTENARIPIDDPNTHLELTMIHEVMVLDHGGPDFAFILYASALKLWVLGALFVGLLLPIKEGSPWLQGLAFVGGMFALAVIVGVIESVMARLRLIRIPQLLAGAAALAALAMILALRQVTA